MRAPDGQLFDIAPASEEERYAQRLDALYYEAEAALAEQDWAAAIRLLQSILSQQPRHARAAALLQAVEERRTSEQIEGEATAEALEAEREQRESTPLDEEDEWAEPTAADSLAAVRTRQQRGWRPGLGMIAVALVLLVALWIAVQIFPGTPVQQEGPLAGWAYRGDVVAGERYQADVFSFNLPTGWQVIDETSTPGASTVLILAPIDERQNRIWLEVGTRETLSWRSTPPPDAAADELLSALDPDAELVSLTGVSSWNELDRRNATVGGFSGRAIDLYATLGSGAEFLGRVVIARIPVEDSDDLIVRIVAAAPVESPNADPIDVVAETLTFAPVDPPYPGDPASDG
jgi:hypothetical protein